MRYIIVFLLILPFQHALADIKSVKQSHSISAQIGFNGDMSHLSTFELQLFPLDLAYSYKLYDNNTVILSTSSFYDNIGVYDAAYRIGQRLDIGYEFSDTTVYTTLGIANMFIDNGIKNYASPVYGFGIVQDINHNVSSMIELNFQDIKINHNSVNIANLSIGFTYSFGKHKSILQR